MAKGNGRRGTKSEAIRELLRQNPRMKVSAIVAALKDKGIDANPNLVYLVKGKMKRRQRRQKREQMLANSTKTGIANPLDFLLKIKKLANDAGGIRKLKQLVDVLAE